jgi:hypothetical protein
MAETLQVGIVTGAAIAALVALALPALRRRSKGRTSSGATCANCVSSQARRTPVRK